MKTKLLFIIFLFLSITACTQEKIPKGSKATQMKCGSGKCGNSKN